MRLKSKKASGLCTGILAGTVCLLAAGCAATCLADTIPGYIYASSELAEPGYDHSAWRVQDHDLTTAWTEGVEGHGYGECLYFETDPYAVITGGTVIPGFYKSESLFYKNNAPNMLYMRTGSQEAYVDMMDYAQTYYDGFDGYHFVFDEPLVSDGLVTITITSVRPGSVYDDTCITELYLEGYQATADTAPSWPDDEPHVSVAFPDENYDGADDGDSEGQGVPAPDVEPAALGTERVRELTAFADTLYKLHCQHANAKSMSLKAEDLYSYSHAYMLNWYQSCMVDERITRGGDSNYAAYEDLMMILRETFTVCSPGDDIQALCEYFGADREGEMIRMNAAGNAPGGETFYLAYPHDVGNLMGLTLLMGDVMVFDPASGSHVKAMQYYAYFEQDADNENVFRFHSLYAE